MDGNHLASKFKRIIESFAMIDQLNGVSIGELKKQINILETQQNQLKEVFKDSDFNIEDMSLSLIHI